MRCHIAPVRLRHRARRRARRQNQRIEVDVDRVVQRTPACTSTAAAGTAPRAASVRQAIAMVAATSSDEGGQRERVMAARQHQRWRRRDRAASERGRRHRVDAAALGVGPEQEAGHDQRRGKRKADQHVEGVRRRAHRRGCPRCRAGSTRAPKTIAVIASQRHSREARERKGGSGNDREIDVERPVVRLVGGDEQRRDIGADKAKRRRAPGRATARPRALRAQRAPSSTNAMPAPRKP